MLDGRRVPLTGRVSMDLCAVDVTGIDAARPGAPVAFLGPALEDFAAAAGTLSYEVLTRLGPRLQRVYRE
jgi:alanine racemase